MVNRQWLKDASKGGERKGKCREEQNATDVQAITRCRQNDMCCIPLAMETLEEIQQN